MKISSTTKSIIRHFIGSDSIGIKFKDDYSIALLYTNKCYPTVLGISQISSMQEGLKAVSLNISRKSANNETTPLNAIKRASNNQLHHYLIDGEHYYLGYSCIFSNNLVPIFLTYVNFSNPVLQNFSGISTITLYINGRYVNNDNKFNNFLSKKMIPTLTLYGYNINILDEEVIKKFALTPINLGTDKKLCWELINKQQ